MSLGDSSISLNATGNKGRQEPGPLGEEARALPCSDAGSERYCAPRYCALVILVPIPVIVMATWLEGHLLTPTVWSNVPFLPVEVSS